MNQQALMKMRKLQQQIQEAQDKMQNMIFTGSAGGNMVQIKMYGDHRIEKVIIDKDAIDSKDDVEMLEDTILAAFNDCLKKIEDENQKIMGPLSAGLPGGLF